MDMPIHDNSRNEAGEQGARAMELAPLELLPFASLLDDRAQAGYRWLKWTY